MHILWTKLLFKRLFYIQLFLSHRVFFFLIQRIIFIGSRHVTFYYYYYYFFIISHTQTIIVHYIYNSLQVTVIVYKKEIKRKTKSTKIL